jgi:signal transduction histidine kinase
MSDDRTRPLDIYQQPTILISFHDHNTRLLFKKLLDQVGSVTAVNSRAETLEQLAQDTYDVIVLDDDLELLKATHSLDPVVPIIVVSPLTDNANIVNALQHGANDHITWPYDAEVIRARVRCQIDLQKRLIKQQHALTQLREAFENKDRFLRIATHDLKNPLNNIRLAQFYLRRIIGDNPQAVEALDTVELAVDAMNQLIMDFLDTAAIESGKTELHIEPVVLEDALWDVIARHASAANQKNITLLLAETEGIALADQRRLLQILSNLVSNAIKYSPHDDFVTVASTQTNDWVRITVTDDGPGIAQDERAALFEPFTRLSARPTGGENSTGLGLWIVKELVALHSGHVGVDCPPQGGSVFWVELPAARHNDQQAFA